MSSNLHHGMMPQIASSVLPPVGPARSSREVVEWLDTLADSIRLTAGQGALECILWSYRKEVGGIDRDVMETGWYPVEVHDKERLYCLSIIIDGPPGHAYHLHPTDPVLPTAAEALHCVSQLVHRLNATVSLPPFELHKSATAPGDMQ